MLFADDFPFALRNSSVIYYVYFSNRIMIQFNKYLPSAHFVGHREGVWPGLGKGKRTLWLSERTAGLGGRLPQSSAPPALCSQGPGCRLLLAGEPWRCRPCAFKSAWRGASAHPGAGSGVALLALLAATG